MRARAPVLLLLAAILPAQGRLDPAPEGAFLVLETDGPARWRSRFADTKLGALVASKRFQEVWAPVAAQIDARLAEAQKHPLGARAAYEAVLAHAGRVRGVLYMEMGANEEPVVWGYIAVGQDGHNDLVAASRFVQERALDDEPSLERISIGGTEWLAVGVRSDTFITVPTMVGDELAILFGAPNKVDAMARLFTAEPPAPRPAGEQVGPAVLDLRVDAGKLLALGARDDARFPALLSALGVEELGALAVRITPKQRFTEVAVEVVTGRRRGLMGALYPAAKHPPAALDLVPREHTSYWIMPIDPGQIVPGIEALVAATTSAPRVSAGLGLRPNRGPLWEEVEARVQESTGVRLGADLLAHLGPEVLWLQGPKFEADPDDGPVGLAVGLFDGYCLGLTLRDSAAFAHSLESMVERSGLARTRKTEQYRGVAVHRISVPVVARKVYWCVADGLAVAAFGEQGLANLHGLLDGVARRARGERPGPLARGCAERLAPLPEGHCSVSYQSFANVLDLWGAAVELASAQQRESALDPELVVQVLRDLHALLMAHDLGAAVTVTYQENDRVLQRTIW